MRIAKKLIKFGLIGKLSFGLSGVACQFSIYMNYFLKDPGNYLKHVLIKPRITTDLVPISLKASLQCWVRHFYFSNS